MDAVKLIQRLHQHRTWVNNNLLAAAAPLTAEQLQRTFPIGQGSLWKSLTHMYAAEYVWLEALLGHEEAVIPGDAPGKLPGNQLGEGGLTGLDDLRQKWSELSLRWDQYLEALNPENLDEIVYRKSVALGHRLGTRRSDVLLHISTHAHYTTAQVINMLRQVGVQTLPESMLILLARHEAAGTTAP